MIEVLAEKMAIKIKNANESQTASLGVLKYGLIIIINFLIPCISALIIGLILGQFTLTVVALVSFVSIRLFSGGHHFKSAGVCSFFSTLFIAVPPHIPLPEFMIFPMTIVIFILFAIFSPSNIKGYARLPEKYFPIMKLVSLLIVSSNFLFVSSTLTLIFALQALSLLIANRR